MSEAVADSRSPLDPAAAEPSGRTRLVTALAGAPLIPPAVGLAAGIALDFGFPQPLWAYVTLFGLAGMGLVLLRRRAAACSLMAAFAAVGVGASLHHGAFWCIAEDSIVRYTDAMPHNAVVRGVVATEPSVSRSEFGLFNDCVPHEPRTRFLIEAKEIEGRAGPLRASGLVRVSVAEPLLDLRAGDRVRLCGRLYRPVPPGNPGATDWPLYQRRRGVLAGLSCEHAADVTRIGGPGADAGWLTRFRRHCRRLLLDDVSALDTADVSVLEAMILGQRSVVDRAINDAFVATGTVHILSVSGAHLGMLAGAIWTLAALAGRSRRQTALIVLAAVILYAAIAEPSAPVLRSAITAAVLCLGLILRRPVRTANWLAASAILVLTIRPCDLFDAGFQLSYVTLSGVLYLSGPVRDAWRWLLFREDELIVALRPRQPDPEGVRRVLKAAARGVENVLAVCVGAWLVGAPLSLYHFGQTSTWGWLNSALISPLVAVVIVGGFVKLLAAALWSGTGAVLGPALAECTRLLDGWVRALASIPGTSVMTPSPPLWLVLLALAVCGLWMMKRTLKIPGHAIALGLGACMVASVFWYLPGRPGDGELRVRVLAVGNGTAILMRLPNGRAIAYDIGTMPPYEIYRATLRPALGAERIRRLDAVIVSHPDLDHFSGLPDLARWTPVREVWASPNLLSATAPARTTAARLLRDDLKRRRVPVRTLNAGDRLRNAGDVDAEVLWPPANEPDVARDSNESSIVLRLRCAGHAILLCGDIERLPQQWLAAHADIRADVLVLPHHGSFQPWTADFVRAVAPTYVIRSSGRRSEYGPPGLHDLLCHYAAFNTADVGSVLVRMGPSGLRITAGGDGEGRNSPGSAYEDSPARPRTR